jgi:hypothetical protein
VPPIGTGVRADFDDIHHLVRAETSIHSMQTLLSKYGQDTGIDDLHDGVQDRPITNQMMDIIAIGKIVRRQIELFANDSLKNDGRFAIGHHARLNLGRYD